MKSEFNMALRQLVFNEYLLPKSLTSFASVIRQHKFRFRVMRKYSIICILLIITFCFSSDGLKAQSLACLKNNPVLYNKYKTLEERAPKEIQIMIGNLRKMSEERVYAAIQLRDRTPDNKYATLALFEMLVDTREFVYKSQLKEIERGESHYSTTPADEAALTLKNIGRPALELLIAGIKDDWIGQQCVNILSKIDDPQVFPLLIETLNDPRLDICREAIAGLARLNDPAALEPLSGLLTNQKLKYEAISAIAYIKDPHSLEILELQYFVPDGNVRLHIVRALKNVENNDVIPIFLRALKDDWSLVREESARVLGNYNDPRIAPQLIDAIDDQYFSVAEQAIRSLGKINDTTAKETLVRLMNEGGPLANEASFALAEMKIPSAIKHLVKLLRDPQERIRQDAVNAILKMNDRNVVDPLLLVYNDENYDLIKITEIFEIMSDPRVFDPLIRKLSHKVDIIRQAAAKALGAYHDARAIEPLINALKDNSDTVRKEASYSLSKITKEDFGDNFDLWMKWWADSKQTEEKPMTR
jgi:HEAT repeat protein